MQINNLQRMIESLQIKDEELKDRIKTLVEELDKNENEKAIMEMVIMLSRMASKNKIELEAALYNENRGFSCIGNL
ncbi:MAG: hypothetical protein HY515_01640 [Candidatus Aenigmarchaeota archaeon]|nr:hypothetical protein [Candidatus Aenigmarchaeota archaeon]